MQRSIGLAPLTALELSPPEAVQIAAQAGYTHIGFRLMQGPPPSWFHPMQPGSAMLRETKQALADTGLIASDAEIIRLNANTDIAVYDAMMDSAAELGIAFILIACEDHDIGAMSDKFGAICDLAASRGINPMLEFMPWLGINNISRARQVIEAAARPNGRILVDAIHVDRGGDTAADVAAIPAATHSFFQICDLPAQRPSDTEGLLFQARQERLVPGDGGIDVAGMVRALPADLLISVEIPQAALAQTMPTRDRLQMLRERSLAFVERTLCAPPR